MTVNDFYLTPKRKEIFSTMGFIELIDVLRYFPTKFNILKLEKLWIDNNDKKITIEGKIISDIKTIRFGAGKMKTTFKIDYLGDIVNIVLFNRFSWSKILKISDNLVITGKYNYIRSEIIANTFFIGTLAGDIKVIPVYSLPESIKKKTYETLVRYCYDQLSKNLQIHDIVPRDLISKYRLISLDKALKYYHFPNNEDEIAQALRHLKYEELLLFSLKIQLIKEKTAFFANKTKKNISMDNLKRIAAKLPYTLTEDQRIVIKEIFADLMNSKPMSRILQGDVGSGKTIVSFIALLTVMDDNYQGAFMAPTDILARQHYHNFKKMFGDEISSCLLVSDMPEKEKKIVINKIENGDIKLIIGTHTLIQKYINFKNLGLVVIDEQHRFGVKQRELLKEKGKELDVLYMSATPIPRTLASVFYGEIDVSTINQFPHLGKKILTNYIQKNSLSCVDKEIKMVLSQNNKIFIICPMVQDTNDELKNVKIVFNELIGKYKKANIGLVHGKLNAKEKESVMNEFTHGNMNILVSTTVVEVGVDIKDASMIIILNAERFGLAQIHQLRGRVGRSGQESFCYLLSDSEDEDVHERLSFMSENNDGFKISEFDLKRRGMGDLLGVKQSGMPKFSISNLYDDFKIFEVARTDSIYIMNNKKKFEYIIEKVEKLLLEEEHFFE